MVLRGATLIKLTYWILGFVTGILISLSLDNCHNTQEMLLTAQENKYFHIHGKVNPSHHIYNEYAEKESNIFVRKAMTTTTFASTTTKQTNQNIEILTCEEVRKIYLMAKTRPSIQNIERYAYTVGSKAIYFTEIVNQTGARTRVVVKEASMRNQSAESDLYRHRSALREIENMRKLEALHWTGIPKLLGTCISKYQIIYVVTEIIGDPVCDGNGTDFKCGMSRKIKDFIERSQNPSLFSLTWISKVICFFKQFEKHQVFMEDFSGANFFFSPTTFDLFIVDPDSLLFYNGIALGSRVSCRTHFDCGEPKGNQWRYHSLNHKIYYSCQETRGYCLNNTCRGYDVSLHTCGIGRWLIYPVSHMVPSFVRTEFSVIMDCMMKRYPEARCSLFDSCENANYILNKYINFTNTLTH